MWLVYYQRVKQNVHFQGNDCINQELQVTTEFWICFYVLMESLRIYGITEIFTG